MYQFLIIAYLFTFHSNEIERNGSQIADTNDAQSEDLDDSIADPDYQPDSQEEDYSNDAGVLNEDGDSREDGDLNNGNDSNSKKVDHGQQQIGDKRMMKANDKKNKKQLE